MADYDNAQTYDKQASRYAAASKEGSPWLYFDKPVLDIDLDTTLDETTHILEVGCGSGKVIDYLTNRGISDANITGIDTSKELLKVAQQGHPLSTFIAGDIVTTSLPVNAFDVIIAVRVFEYLSNEGLRKALASCYEALHSGGILFIIVGHPIRVNGPDITTYSDRGERQHRLPGNIPVTLYHKTLADYINAAIQANLQIALVKETTANPQLKKDRPEDYARYSSYGAVSLVLRLIK